MQLSCQKGPEMTNKVRSQYIVKLLINDAVFTLNENLNILDSLRKKIGYLSNFFMPYKSSTFLGPFNTR